MDDVRELALRRGVSKAFRLVSKSLGCDTSDFSFADISEDEQLQDLDHLLTWREAKARSLGNFANRKPIARGILDSLLGTWNPHLQISRKPIFLPLDFNIVIGQRGAQLHRTGRTLRDLHSTKGRRINLSPIQFSGDVLTIDLCISPLQLPGENLGSSPFSHLESCGLISLRSSLLTRIWAEPSKTGSGKTYTVWGPSSALTVDSSSNQER
ncbi:hypothetical protein KSP39_PZI019349 [Platanthera zijinensis]|uniref:Uncharacterized protein n=1 Tax=Platanthera zijinensis TaxID=2320716 RepID=A0AAP0FXU9_9ASPA